MKLRLGFQLRPQVACQKLPWYPVCQLPGPAGKPATKFLWPETTR